MSAEEHLYEILDRFTDESHWAIETKTEFFEKLSAKSAANWARKAPQGPRTETAFGNLEEAV